MFLSSNLLLTHDSVTGCTCIKLPVCYTLNRQLQFLEKIHSDITPTHQKPCIIFIHTEVTYYLMSLSIEITEHRFPTIIGIFQIVFRLCYENTCIHFLCQLTCRSADIMSSLCGVCVRVRMNNFSSKTTRPRDMLFFFKSYLIDQG